VAPIGWSDCAWDYEQGQGYIRQHFVGPSDPIWFEDNDDEFDWGRWPFMDMTWSYDEVGLYPPDLSDEQEDELTGTAPLRYVDRRGFFDHEKDEFVLHREEVEEEETKDPHAEAWLDELLAAEQQARRDAGREAALRLAAESRQAAQKKREAEEARLQEARAMTGQVLDNLQEAQDAWKERTVSDPYRRRPLMSRKAQRAVAEHARSGQEGDFELEIVDGDQRLRWSYTLTDGKAYLTSKKIAWIPLAERR
jgi:hypothetical protein